MQDTFGAVDRQHPDRGAADVGEAHEDWPVPMEVLLPVVDVQMEKANEQIRFRVEARDIRTFVTVAFQAGKSKIFGN